MPRRRLVLTAALAAALLAASCGYNPKESGGQDGDLGFKGTVECLFPVEGCHALAGTWTGTWADGAHANPAASPSAAAALTAEACASCHNPVEASHRDAAWLFSTSLGLFPSLGNSPRPLVGCEGCHGTGTQHYAYLHTGADGAAVVFTLTNPSALDDPASAQTHYRPDLSTVFAVFEEPFAVRSCAGCHDAKVHAGGTDGRLSNQRQEWTGGDGPGFFYEDGHSDSLVVETAQGSMAGSVRGRPCVACHTVEGFVRLFAWADSGWVSSPSEIARLVERTGDTDLGDPGILPGAEALSQVSCVSCHPSHEPGRRLRQLLLEDAGAQDDTQRRAALCPACHNARGLSAQAGAGLVSTATLETPRHPQREVFLGGSEAFALTVAVASSHGSTHPERCTLCHYVVRSDASLSESPQKATSGHRFAARLEGCLDSFRGCHPASDLLLPDGSPFAFTDSTIGAFDFASVLLTPAAGRDHDGDGTVEPFQVEVQGLLDRLREALQGEGAPYDAAQGLFDLPLMASQSATVRAAAYDFDAVAGDGSRGLHNPRGVVDALKAGLAALGR